MLNSGPMLQSQCKHPYGQFAAVVTCYVLTAVVGMAPGHIQLSGHLEQQGLEETPNPILL